MKTGTKIMLWVASAFMFASFMNLDEIVGLIAVGIFAFCYIYDEKLRRKFYV